MENIPKKIEEDYRIDDISEGIPELKKAILSLKKELDPDDFALFCGTSVKGEGLKDRLLFLKLWGDFNKDPIGTIRNYALEKIDRIKKSAEE